MTDLDEARADALQGWLRESEVLDELRQQTAEAAARRDSYVMALYDTDLTYAEIGGLLGVAPARVGQIVARARSRRTG